MDLQTRKLELIQEFLKRRTTVGLPEKIKLNF